MLNCSCCSLVQGVGGPSHILGHTLDVLISPCDSDFDHKYFYSGSVIALSCRTSCNAVTWTIWVWLRLILHQLILTVSLILLHQPVTTLSKNHSVLNCSCCSLVQGVGGPSHILGHTLDVLISPCDSDFVRNVSVGDFISDHAAIRCQLDFSHPSTSIDKLVSYCWYHKIKIDQFCKDLNTIYHLFCPPKKLL